MAITNPENAHDNSSEQKTAFPRLEAEEITELAAIGSQRRPLCERVQLPGR